MNPVVTKIDTGSVACDICRKEIPQSEAGIVEVEDYVLYFCGMDCFRQWRETQDSQRE